MSHPVHDRVLAFIADPGSGSFDDLALDVFRHQYETVAPYRRFCDARRVIPERVRSWRDVPPVPVLAFKEVELACGPPVRTFRSTGTTRGPERRSTHAMPDLRLYYAAAMGGLRRFLLPDVSAIRFLSLVHTPAAMPESSLAQMVAWAVETFGSGDTAYAVAAGGLDADRAAAALRASEKDGAPLCILATTAALIRLLDLGSAKGWTFRLPHGSRLMDTGGGKGTPRLLSRKGLLHAAWNALAIPGYFCVNEYGMSELSSQAWENVIRDRVAGRVTHRAFATPPWMRTRILDPARLQDVASGERGLLCHYDLANAGTAMAVLTEDIGRSIRNGFEILGRAGAAEMRGCSLVWES